MLSCSGRTGEREHGQVS